MTSTPTPAWPAGRPAPGPLSRLRVLDLSRILAGPFATMQLADLGADVVKVEAPGAGDETRRWGPPFLADGTAAYFTAVNRNKRAITLDLNHPDAAAIARRLAMAADVVIDNFLPGRLRRFGLDHDTLAAANPRIVTCTICGYGSDTSKGHQPGFDFLMQAEGGLMAITGAPGTGPTKVGVAIVDLVAGLFATVGVLAALHRRERTGRGGHVEVSLLDAAVGVLANQAAGFLVTGEEPRRLGNAHPSIAPYESLRTADRPIAVGVGTDRQFQRLVTALGLPELAQDPRFRTNADRVRRRRELKKLLEQRLATDGRDRWLSLLADAGVPAAPINSLGEVFADPLVRDRLRVDIGGVPQVRSPVRLDGQPIDVHTPPPALGADTDEVLASLGLAPDEIQRLHDAGAI
jgi:crotonobetainyl-CoA:carnitine CoA-transferase CaiB-like acyl-CoA transferase